MYGIAALAAKGFGAVGWRRWVRLGGGVRRWVLLGAGVRHCSARREGVEWRRLVRRGCGAVGIRGLCGRILRGGPLGLLDGLRWGEGLL